jgi:exopolysaccharide biosynthesis polyprenyl glycosylphosphotransferase
MRRAGLEWFYRLCLEPGRLWKRYVIGNLIFTFRVAILVLVDILTAAISWLAAYYLSGSPAFRAKLSSVLPSVFPEQLNEVRYYLFALPFIIGLWIAISFAFGLYRRQKGLTHFEELICIFKTAFLFLISALAVAFLFKEWDLGRSVVFLATLLGLILLGVSRLVYHTLEKWGLRSGLGRISAVIVGTGPLSLKVRQRMEDHPTRDHDLLGFFSVGAEEEGVQAGLPVIGPVESLPSLINGRRVDEIFFASEALSHRDILNVIASCSEIETNYKIVSDMFEVLTSRSVNVEEIDDIPVIDLGSGRPGAFHRFLKRTMDLGIALLLAPFAGIVLLAIALFLRIRWPDYPVLFKHERVGKDGKLFFMYKFRTMDPRVDLYAEAPTDPNDQRISGRLGRFLRRTSLDELPQLWNVIRGEMSLVGPRPEMPFIVDRYKDWQRRRLVVKPGITGLWQIMGRKDLPLHANLEYDFYYIQNQSILFDLAILLKTLPVVLLGKGAY